MTKSQSYKSLPPILVALFVLICLPIAGWGQSVEQGKNEDGPVKKIQFKDARVKAVLTTFGKQLNINVVYDDAVKDVNLNIELNDMTMKAVMKIILDQEHLQARLIEEKTIIIFPDTEANRQRYEQYKVWPEDTDKKL